MAESAFRGNTGLGGSQAPARRQELPTVGEAGAKGLSAACPVSAHKALPHAGCILLNTMSGDKITFD